MVDALELRKKVNRAHTNEPISRGELPDSAVTLDALKILETELERRGHLRGRRCFPLWFHAETERNIFLWRRGRSLIEADEFEFWVDVNRLVEKRDVYLSGPTVDNPLLNPSWTGDPAEPVGDEERQYLKELSEALAGIKAHVHALSYVGRLLLASGREEEREIVLLPVKRMRLEAK